MSYDIVQKIKVEGDKVMITSASNNVRPHYYEKWECYLISKTLQENGQGACDLEILKAYESGDFQGGSNKYTRALEVLFHFPEYEKFNWRGSINISYEEAKENRKSLEFEELLKKALNTYLPKDKYILTKLQTEGRVYLYKLTTRFARWTWEKERAKIFRWKEAADGVKRLFSNSDSWEVEKIA